MRINKVGIIGLGLIGGSIAKALKHNNVTGYITAMDRNPDNILQAVSEQGIDREAKVYDDFYDCEVVFICTPVHIIKKILPELVKSVSRSCIITDVGSTKADIMEAASAIGPECTFIGGHPMAGTEKSGYGSSRQNLFENAYYVLTPTEDVEHKKIKKMTELIEGIRAIPVVLNSEIHDFCTSAISHVPHVIASLLVNMVKDLDTSEQYLHLLAAGGFKDLTRIASSSPEMWESICMANKTKIIHILEYLQDKLCDFLKELNLENRKEINGFFSRARDYRNTFSDLHPGVLMKVYDIVVDVEDEPGTIAKIATILSRHSINIRNIGILHSRESVEGALEITFYDRESQEKSIQILKENGYAVS